MDNKYELFLCNDAVVNIKTEEEFHDFVSLMEKLGLEKIKYINNIYSKYGFEHGFCFNGGIKEYNPSELCFEYQLGKGFTCSSKDKYQEWGSEILSLDQLKEATGYSCNIDKNSSIEQSNNECEMEK